ncbi:hypothetical protein gpAD87_02155 [Paenibacillus sp. AD87]|nr:hypothetical protein gpAD87_02155 [Paenibacillus sp. AD87]
MVVLLFILSVMCGVLHKHQIEKALHLSWNDIPWTVKINVSLWNWIAIATHPPIFDEGKNPTYDNSASHE